MDRNIRVRILYIVILYIVFIFLFKRLDFTVRYLINIIFLVYLFVEFIFGQLDFYKERFRLKFIFISSIINILFASVVYSFLKEESVFVIFGIIFIFQIIFRKIVSSKYVKKQNVLIFGSNHIDNGVQEDLINNLDYNYIGYISDNESRATKYLLGKYSILEKIVKEKNIDMLVVVKDTKNPSFKQYLKRLFDLKVNGIKILNYEDFNENIQKKIDINQINEEWLLQSNGFEILNNESQKNTKRALDFILAITLMIIASPIGLIASIIIKLESKGPIIFKQLRIGENGRIFKVYKFRSMKIHDIENCSKYATDNDDRITKFGKFMRKTRIDELPQLWNVMKGTMSFVGPRPEWDILAKEYEEKIPFYNLRHLIKPGITGWAQVMYPYGENLEDTKRKLEYDLYYIKKQDLIMDVLVIMKTAKVIIFGKGK